MLIEGGEITNMLTASPISITIWAIVALTLIGGTIAKLLPKRPQKQQPEPVESLVDAD